MSESKPPMKKEDPPMNDDKGETDKFNLLTAPWIPVLYRCGKWTRVGIKKALTDAHVIRQIAASNPMDNVALLRFLLAVLIWCKPEMQDDDRMQMNSAKGIPSEWLQKMDEDEHKVKFYLLGDGERFFQDVSLKGEEERPIGDLLVEFPGADSVNHTRHVLHGSYGFCPACCAMGMLRFSVWASANRFYPASVNPPSAAYAIATGNNLSQTLLANVPDNICQTSKPPWLSDSQPSLPLETATALAWRPRKLWLGDAAETGVCANCGNACGLIKMLALGAGWPTPQTESQSFSKLVEQRFKELGYRAKDPNVKKAVKASWAIFTCRLDKLREACNEELRKSLDPAAPKEELAGAIAHALEDVLKKNGDAFKNLVKKTSREEGERIGRENLRQKKFWELDPQLLISGNEALSLPGLESDSGMHAKFWRLAFHAWSRERNERSSIVIGPVVNQFAYQDAAGVSLPDASAEARVALSDGVYDELLDLVKQVTPNPKLKHPEIRSALALHTPETEARIRAILRGPGATGNDREFLYSTFQPLVRKVVSSTARGSAFKRRLALSDACDKLEKVIDSELRAKQQNSGSAKGGTS